jgi:hypothetical protein
LSSFDKGTLDGGHAALEPVKEWHFHTYWFAKNQRTVVEAHALVTTIAEDREFVAVRNGITSAHFPAQA